MKKIVQVLLGVSSSVTLILAILKITDVIHNRIYLTIFLVLTAILFFVNALLSRKNSVR
jgi:hypothetical protein